jgi:hypothetical protein
VCAGGSILHGRITVAIEQHNVVRSTNIPLGFAPYVLAAHYVDHMDPGGRASHDDAAVCGVVAVTKARLACRRGPQRVRSRRSRRKWLPREDR